MNRSDNKYDALEAAIRVSAIPATAEEILAAATKIEAWLNGDADATEGSE